VQAMAAISTRVPEEESLIDAEDPEALALAQEDDSFHTRENADANRPYTHTRSWRLGLGAVGILCAVALVVATTRGSTEAEMVETKNVDGVTRLQYAAGPPAASSSGISGMMSGMFDKMTGGLTTKVHKYYQEAKTSALDYVPTWAGGTLGKSTTTTFPYNPYATTPYYGMPPAAPATTIINGKAYAMPPSLTTAAPVQLTTIINGKIYAAPPVLGTTPPPLLVAPAAALPTLVPPNPHAATTQPPIIAPANGLADANKTIAMQGSEAAVVVDMHVTGDDVTAQVATNPAGVQPCSGANGAGVHPDGTDCVPLKTYPYPPEYAGYTTNEPPNPDR